MAEENTITTVFRADISQFSASTQALNQYVRQVNSQFEAATAGMGKWSDNTDGLRAKIAQLNGILEADKKKLAMLTEQYKQLEAAGEGNSYQANQLKIAINKQIAAIKNTEKQTENYTASLNELEKAGVNTKQELDDLTKTEEKQGKTAGALAGALGKTLVGGLAAVSAAAIAAGAALVKMTADVAKNGDEIDKESQKLGISSEAYQKLSYAMERSGADISDITRGMREITQELADVENGTEGAGAAFTDLGIDLTNADGSMKSTEQVLLDSIDALAKMENATQRDALAQKIFGRSSQELAPLLNEGADGVKALMQEAEDYGMVMSGDAVKASASFADSLAKVKGTVGGLKNQLVGALIPSFTQVTDGFADMIAGVDGGAEKMAQGIEAAISNLSGMIPQITATLSTIAKAVLQSAPEVLKSLADAVMQAVPSLIPVISDVATQLVKTAAELAPKLVSTIAVILKELAGALSAQLPTLIPIVIEGILDLVGAILDNLDGLIDAAIAIIMALADGLIDALPKLIDKAPEIIDKLITAINRNMPKLIKAGIELTIKLTEGLIKATPQLVAKLPQIIASIVKGLLEGFSEMASVGVELVKGLWQGISSSFDWIKNKLKEWVGNVTDFIKNLFGIHSPSRLFRDEIGKNLALGIGAGFSDEMGAVEKKMAAVVGRIAPSMQINPTIAQTGGEAGFVDRLAEIINERQGGNTVNNYSFDYKFERMQTSRLALHQAEIVTRRIVSGG